MDDQNNFDSDQSASLAKGYTCLVVMVGSLIGAIWMINDAVHDNYAWALPFDLLGVITSLVSIIIFIPLTLKRNSAGIVGLIFSSILFIVFVNLFIKGINSLP